MRGDFDFPTRVAFGAGRVEELPELVRGWGSRALVVTDRGVVGSGVYRLVRHPIYAGYLLTHLFFLLAHPVLWNLVLLVVGDAALIVRALREEHVLARRNGRPGLLLGRRGRLEGSGEPLAYLRGEAFECLALHVTIQHIG